MDNGQKILPMQKVIKGPFLTCVKMEKQLSFSGDVFPMNIASIYIHIACTYLFTLVPHR